MIIKHLTDNDLYKFTTMYAIQKLYPHAKVKYEFINRGKTPFPEGFDEKLKAEVERMAQLSLSSEEENFLKTKCYFFDPVFIDFLKGYRFNPDEVDIRLNDGKLDISISGYWYRTVLWEVPLMAIVSEFYFKETGHQPLEVEERAQHKGKTLAGIKASYSEFGTRRRFSFDVQDRVVKTLKDYSDGYFNGTSNVYLAMKHHLKPIGTHPHEWFMYHAAHFGYRQANYISLKSWTTVYRGSLGIALTDTFTTDNFFDNFDLKYAKLFDGLRWDSGDAIEFTQKALDYYKKQNIDSTTKTIVYSDSLNLDKIKQIKEFTTGKIRDAYGIGTYFTNDVGAKPLNIVIKMVAAATDENNSLQPTVKLSDVAGKNTGDEAEIALCKKVLNLA